jgi:hypothetical protein
MTEEQKLNWWLDLVCFVLASEELAKHTDKSASEWRTQITDEILQIYQSRAETVLGRNCAYNIKEKHEEWASDFLPRWYYKKKFAHLEKVCCDPWRDTLNGENIEHLDVI